MPMAPTIADLYYQREMVYNQNFGGAVVAIGQTKAYKDNETAALLFDPLGLITLNRVICFLVCSKWCPLKYANDERSYEYQIKSACCSAPWMEVHRGSSADVENEKPGAEDVPLGYTHKHVTGSETFAIGDYIKDGDSYKKGPLKYGIRNKPDCFKKGPFNGFKVEREACDACVQGKVIMHTMMPIYSYHGGFDKAAEAAAKDEANKDFGTTKDWTARGEIIGTVTMQNLLVPCAPCAAQPGACPLTVRIDINEEMAKTMADDDKMKLGLFAHVAAPAAPEPARVYVDALPLPLAWFGKIAITGLGYMFGYGNTNTAYRFTGLQESFAFGLGETGDLIPRAVDAAKEGVKRAKEAAKSAMASATEVASSVADSANAAASSAMDKANAAMNKGQ